MGLITFIYVAIQIIFEDEMLCLLRCKDGNFLIWLIKTQE